MNKILLTAVSAATLLFAAPVFAQAQTAEKTFHPTEDTYLRKGKTDNNGTKEQLEIGTNETKGTDFVGLMKFAVDADIVGHVTKATLRIVSERVKGSPKISLYAYANEWESASKYEDQTANIEAARASEAVGTFVPKGTKGRSVVYDAQDNVSTDIADWTNEIDITEYVKGLTDGTFSLMMAETSGQADNQKYFASEAKDFNPKKDPTITIASADIVPQLTLVYDNSTTAVGGITTAVDAAEAKIFTLQGIRVKTMAAPGIYIVNGKKTVKR